MRPWALTALALTILAFSGCGGGGEEGSTKGVTTTQAQQEVQAQQEEESSSGSVEGEAAQRQGEAESTPRAHRRQIKNPPIASERTPGQKGVAPGVPTTEGGDNSIQAFGTEGEEGDAEKATRSLTAYLEAVEAGQWGEACEEASAEFREQLTQLIEQARTKEGTKKPEGCAQILELLLAGAKGASSFTAQAPQKILSFRVQAPYGYLIYEDTQGTIRFIAMREEGEGWKLNVPQPSELQTTTGGGADESQQ